MSLYLHPFATHRPTQAAVPTEPTAEELQKAAQTEREKIEERIRLEFGSDAILPPATHAVPAAPHIA